MQIRHWLSIFAAAALPLAVSAPAMAGGHDHRDGVRVIVAPPHVGYVAPGYGYGGPGYYHRGYGYGGGPGYYHRDYGYGRGYGRGYDHERWERRDWRR